MDLVLTLADQNLIHTKTSPEGRSVAAC